MSDDFLPSYIVLQHKWKEEVLGETPAGVKDRPVPPSGDWLRTLLQAGLQCFDFQRSVRGTNTAVRSRHPSRASPVPFNPAERGLSYILSAPLVQFWWRSKQRASSQRSMHALSIMAVAFCCSGKYITEIKRKGSSKAISLYTWGGGCMHTSWGANLKCFGFMQMHSCVCSRQRKEVWKQTFSAVCPLTPKLDMCKCMLCTWESFLFLCTPVSSFFLSLSSKDKKFLVWAWHVISKDTCRVKWFASRSQLFPLLLKKEKKRSESMGSGGVVGTSKVSESKWAGLVFFFFLTTCVKWVFQGCGKGVLPRMKCSLSYSQRFKYNESPSTSGGRLLIDASWLHSSHTDRRLRNLSKQLSAMLTQTYTLFPGSTCECTFSVCCVFNLGAHCTWPTCLSTVGLSVLLPTVALFHSVPVVLSSSPFTP